MIALKRYPMLQSVILLITTYCWINLAIQTKLRKFRFRFTEVTYPTKIIIPRNQPITIRSDQASDERPRWRGAKHDTLKLATKLVGKAGRKLIEISQRSSDQAANRRYHATKADTLRDSITEAEEQIAILKIQRKLALEAINQTEDLQDLQDLHNQDISQATIPHNRTVADQNHNKTSNILKTKKNPGRTKNPKPTKTVILPIAKQAHQNHRLKNHGKTSHTIVDLVTEKPGQWRWQVIKFVFDRINCLTCGQLLGPEGGWLIPKYDLYGYGLRALVVSWRMHLGISYENCRSILASFIDLHDEEEEKDEKAAKIVLPNTGTMKKWVKQASITLKPAIDSIHKQIQQADIIHVDETPISINGECWFVWVVCTKDTYYYLLKPNKGLDSLKEVILGCQPKAIVTDNAAVYSATQLRELLGQDLQLQKCIVHIYGNLAKSLRSIIGTLKKSVKKLEKENKKSKKKATKTTKTKVVVSDEKVEKVENAENTENTENTDQSRSEEIQQQLETAVDNDLSDYQRKLLAFIPEFLQLFTLADREDAEDGLKNLYQRLELPLKGNLKTIWTHRDELFVYKDPRFNGALQKTNNISEQAMRIFARMRKRIRCFRSEECLQTELSVLSLYATITSRKQNFTKFVFAGLKGKVDMLDNSDNLPDPPD